MTEEVDWFERLIESSKELRRELEQLDAGAEAITFYTLGMSLLERKIEYLLDPNRPTATRAQVTQWCAGFDAAIMSLVGASVN